VLRNGEPDGKKGDIRRGTGGAFSVAAACSLAFAASWESDALRNLSMEKRRCFCAVSSGLCEWPFADGSTIDGTAWLEAAERLSRGRADEERGAIWVGVLGGWESSETEGRAGDSVLGSARTWGSLDADADAVKLSSSEWRRMSVSLARWPRRRKKGMIIDSFDWHNPSGRRNGQKHCAATNFVLKTLKHSDTQTVGVPWLLDCGCKCVCVNNRNLAGGQTRPIGRFARTERGRGGCLVRPGLVECFSRWYKERKRMN